MTPRFPQLMSGLALTLAIATGCTPGILTPSMDGNRPAVTGADQATQLSAAEFAGNPAIRDVAVVAGVETLNASPAVKASVTEMTQSLAEFNAFEADSAGAGATFNVEGFAVAAKGGRGEDKEAGDGDRGTGKRPAPGGGAACGSDRAGTPGSDVTARVGAVTAGTASDTAPVPRVTPACGPTASSNVKTTVTNPDGSKTRTMTRTRLLPGGGTMTETMVRTVSKTPPFTSFQHVRDVVLPNGVKRHQERDQRMNGDGSGTIKVVMSFTRPDGKTRSTVMTTTISTSGTRTQTGTITRFDGTTVTIGGNGNTVTATDPATQTTVTTTASGGPATVTVVGTTVGTVGGTTPAATASAAPSPASSASAAPSPAATASAAPSPAATASAAPSPAATASAAPSPAATASAAPTPSATVSV
jgi:hypothetical protein